MKDISIRRADLKDTAVIGRMWAALAQEQAAIDSRYELAEDATQRWLTDFPVWHSDTTHRILIADAGSTPVGYARAFRSAPPPVFVEVPEVYVEELYVIGEWRGRGIGTRLLEEMKDWAEKVGASRIRFSVLARNDAARAFWTRSGAEDAIVNATIELAAKPRQRTSRRPLGF